MYSINNKNSVPAFSIIETIVGMAVTGIIIGILFVLFSIVTDRMLDFKNQNQYISDLNRFTYSMNKDIFEKEKIAFQEHQIIFTGYAGTAVSYDFRNEYILRNSETFTDTFNIKLKHIAVDTLKNQSQQLLFQQFKLNIAVGNEHTTDLKFYNRIYANAVLQILPE